HGFVVSFFLQAEDGIRGLYVTGVQTCALPIFLLPAAMSGVEAGSYRPATRNRLPWSAPQSLLPDPTKMRARWWIGRGAGSGCVEIGRASCRERGGRRGGGVAVEASAARATPPG